MAICLARLWELRLSIAVGVVAFISYCLSGGAMYASGILFNELLKRPCDSRETAWNSTVSSNDSATCTSNDTCERKLCGGYTSAEGNVSITAASPVLSFESECGGFGQSRGSTAWTYSVFFFFATIFCLPSGILIDRFGPRAVATAGGLFFGVGFIAASFTSSVITFVLPYGLLGGLGFGFLYTSSLVIVSDHWRRRGYGPAANGVTTSGMGVGTAAFGPISYAIIKRFRWRWYLRVFGFCFLATSALTLIVYRKIKGDEEEEESGSRQKRRIFDRSLLRSPAFIFYFIGVAIMFLGATVPIVHMVRYAIDLCVCESDADYLVTYMGVASVLGRIVIGLFANHKKIRPIYLFQVCVASCAAAVFGTLFITNYGGFVAFMVVFGFFSGAILSFAIVVVGSIVRKEQVPQALGWALFAEGPSSIIASPIAGSAFALAFFVLSFVPYLQRKHPGVYDSKMKINRDKTFSISFLGTKLRESSV
ncbi:monocarboxylate transporter 4-like isoform X2 [Oscarella lobularis]|uniref:monocarboxylate transporter 4-like isoform X2 n=1 Tax=Oscarella lobularis TaxID=121494 RepID=UPI0033142105